MFFNYENISSVSAESQLEYNYLDDATIIEIETNDSGEKTSREYKKVENNAAYDCDFLGCELYGEYIFENWDDESLFVETPEFIEHRSENPPGPGDGEVNLDMFWLFAGQSYAGRLDYIMVPINHKEKGLWGHITKPFELIDIGDTEKAGGNEELDSSRMITEGKIVGAVYPYGDWATEASKVIYSGKIMLFRHNSAGGKDVVTFRGSGSGDSARNVENEKNSDGGYKYNEFPLELFGSEEEGLNGLYEGTYTLTYHHSEKGDPLGDAKASWYTQVSKVEFFGSVTFDLAYNDDGTGTLSYSEQGGPHEKESEEKTDKMTHDNGIFIDVEEQSAMDDILDNALISAANTILSAITKLISWASEMIHKMLLFGNEIEDSKGAPAIWKNTRDIALSLLTLGLLLVAFANILGIKPDQYGVVRIVPKMIMAIVLTFFSYLIAAFLLDMMSAFQALLVDASKGAYAQLGHGINSTLASNYNYADVTSALFEIIALIIIGIMVCISIVWLLLVLIVRNAMLYILVAVAPIAFMANILPFTEKYWSQWWAAFWKWGFIGPAITFMLWLSVEFLNGYNNAKFAGTDSNTPEGWMWLIAAAVMIFLAATLPLKMGNDIYGAISGGIKKGWGNKRNPIKNRLDMRASNKDAARNKKLREAQAKRSQKFGGRFLTGMSKDQAAAARNELKGDIGKEMANYTPDQLMAEAVGEGLQAEAAQDMLAEMGRLDVSKDAAFAARMVQRAETDGAFAGKLKDQKDFHASAAMAMAGTSHEGGTAHTNAVTKANKSLEGKAEDLTDTHLQYMAKHNRQALNSLLRDEKAIDTINKSGKQKTKAGLGRAVSYARSGEGGEQLKIDVDNIVNSYAAGSDGEKALSNAAEQDAAWASSHKDNDTGQNKPIW